MRVTFTLFLFFLLFNVNAQVPYELFNSKSQQFFNQPNVNNELVGLKADSVKLNGLDSIYFHYRILSQTSGTCAANGKYPSWLGTKTLRRANNDYVFFNQQNDSIIIKPSTPVGASWIFYKYTNGNYIKATVSSKQYETTFFGASDTVKTISFMAYDNLNNTVFDLYNGKLIKIARSQGAVRLGNFYNFPTDTTFYKRCFGKRLTINDVTDRNVGDIIQDYRADYYISSPNLPYIDTYTTKIYLSKVTPTINTVVYTASVTVQTKTLFPQTFTNSAYTATASSTSIQTITVNHLDSITVKQMPQQLINMNIGPGFYGGNPANYYHDPNASVACPNLTVIKGDCATYVGTSDSCLGITVSCPVPTSTTYRLGIGSYNSTANFGPNSSAAGQPGHQMQPKYLSSTNCNFGNPLYLILKENSLQSELKLYPNPVHDNLNIGFVSEQLINEIKIIDMLGKEILSFKNERAIRVSELNDGIYFIKIRTDKGEIIQKFIKE